MAFIIDAVRSPFGRFNGGLSGVRPDDLAANTITNLLARNPEIDVGDISEVVLGCSNQAGEDSRNVARVSALLAGIPPHVPGMTVNRLCGSGMESVLQVARAVDLGVASLSIAGGVESMSRSPRILPFEENDRGLSNMTLIPTVVGWRQPNPIFPGDWNVTNIESAEIIAKNYGITREAQDHFAHESHFKADEAWKTGIFEQEVAPVMGSHLEVDEVFRSDSEMRNLANLRTVVGNADSTVTAGNSSALADGAAMLLVGDLQISELHGYLATIESVAIVGNEPHLFGVAPILASKKALHLIDKEPKDMAIIEINEAFASQTLAVMKGLELSDGSVVNSSGGAIALGHPLGASGARIVAHVAHSLFRRGGGYGLATICIGMGQAIAMVLRR